MIEARGLAFGTPDGRALGKDLSFALHSGGALLITGPNGAGKTTLLQVILGQRAPLAGSLKRNVDERRIGHLPQLQNSSFHLPMTLWDVLHVSQGSPTREQALALGLLEPRHLTLSWNTASGGERKRTLLTRLLLQNPEVLVLDEPMNHLDEDSRKRVQKSLSNFLNTGSPRGIIVVSHFPLSQAELGAHSINEVAL